MANHHCYKYSALFAYPNDKRAHGAKITIPLRNTLWAWVYPANSWGMGSLKHTVSCFSPHNLFSHPLNCMTKLNFIPGLFTKVTSLTPFPQEHFCQRAAPTHRCLRWPFTLLQFWLRGCNFPYAMAQGTARFCLCAPLVWLFKPLHNFMLGRKPHNILQALGILTAKTEHFTSPATSALCEARWERQSSGSGEVVREHMWIPHSRWLCPALPSHSCPRHCPCGSSLLSLSAGQGLGAVAPRKGSAPKPALPELRSVICQQPEIHPSGVFLPHLIAL